MSYRNQNKKIKLPRLNSNLTVFYNCVVVIPLLKLGTNNNTACPVQSQQLLLYIDNIKQLFPSSQTNLWPYKRV